MLFYDKHVPLCFEIRNKIILYISHIILKDLDSLKYLLKAAIIKNHRSLLYLAENAKEEDISQITHHKKGQSLFYHEARLVGEHFSNNGCVTDS